MIKKFIYIILLAFISLNSYSQSWSRYKYEVFYGLGATNFMGDIGAPSALASPIKQMVWVNFWHTIGYAGNAGIRYNFNDRQYIRGGLFLGTLFAEDPKDDPDYYTTRGLKFNTFYTEISGKYEFMVWKEKKRATVYRKLGESPFKNFSMPTYIFVGLGVNLNAGKSFKNSGDNHYVLDKTYFNFAPVIPVGFGFKYKINKLTYFNVEATWNFAIDDKIDNASGKESAAFGTWIDQYQTITFNFVHKIRQNQNGMPKFSKNNRRF